MQSRLSKVSVLLCFALASLASCEEQWGNTARMGYVVEIEENPGGNCTYYMSYKEGSSSHDATVVSSCGAWKVGEGFFISQ